MSGDIRLKVITHEKIVFDDDVEELYVTSKDGQLGILKDHVPIVCALDIGVTKAIKEGECQCIATIGGILQFSHNEAIVLTDCAELDCDIDITRARQARERAEARLKAHDETVDIIRAQLSLARAIARIHARDKRI